MQSGRGRVSASDVVREAIDAHSASLLAEVSAYQAQSRDEGRAR
jgi:Arc/MetJ-type ribon-helix-helix transcriptional regulator